MNTLIKPTTVNLTDQCDLDLKLQIAKAGRFCDFLSLLSKKEKLTQINFMITITITQNANPKTKHVFGVSAATFVISVLFSLLKFPLASSLIIDPMYIKTTSNIAINIHSTHGLSEKNYCDGLGLRIGP
jgi:hypothetical protein